MLATPYTRINNNYKMYTKSPSTKNHMSPGIIQFSDFDEKSVPTSPNHKPLPRKSPAMVSFTNILEAPSLDLPSESSALLNQILLIHCYSNTLVLNDDPQIDKILFQQKMRFIVEVSFSRNTNECITLVERPLFSDSNQCKYYTLKCYLNSESTTMSYYLLRFSYSISMYFSLFQVNEKTISFLNIALKNMKPSIWRVNNLFLGSQQQEELGSTAYDNTTFQSNYREVKNDLSTLVSRSTERQPRTGKNKVDNLKHRMLNHFTHIFSMSYQSKIIDLINKEKLKGIYYKLNDLINLTNKINTNTLLLADYENEILKSNMLTKVTLCKALYNTLSSSIYNSGRNIGFSRLRVLLSDMYSSVVDSFDREFESFEGIEDHEIHREILKRWIEKEEQQIFDVNSILHESESTKMIQTQIKKETSINLSIEKFFERNTDRQAKQISLDSLIIFLRGVYMDSIKNKIQDIEHNNKKKMIREINYYENPAEMLKNCEQRLNLSNDKRQYLLKCIELVGKEIDNLNNLHYGLSLEQERQSRKVKNSNQMRISDNFPNDMRSTFRHQ